jgi:hypothetical protein
MYALLLQDFHVIWSDSDCIWLHPFIHEWLIPNHQKYDILSQMGTFPNVREGPGVMVCTGLLSIFPTDKSKLIMKDFVLHLNTTERDYLNPPNSPRLTFNPFYGNDQLMFNYILFTHGSFSLLYSPKLTYGDVRAHNNRLTYEIIPVKPLFSDVAKVAYLPYEKFPRGKRNGYSMEHQWAYLQPHHPCVLHMQTNHAESRAKMLLLDHLHMQSNITRNNTNVS